MEVKKTVISLYILNTKLDLTVGRSLVVVKISERELDDTSLKSIGCNFSTLCLGNNSLSTFLNLEDRRCN